MILIFNHNVLKTVRNVWNPNSRFQGFCYLDILFLLCIPNLKPQTHSSRLSDLLNIMLKTFRFGSLGSQIRGAYLESLNTVRVLVSKIHRFGSLLKWDPNRSPSEPWPNFPPFFSFPLQCIYG